MVPEDLDQTAKPWIHKTHSVVKITVKRHDVPAIEHLRNLSKVQEYNVALQNRFDCLANEVNLEDMWDNFKQTVTDVSMEVLGKRPRKVKEQHLSQTSKNLIEQRGMFKRRDPTSNVNRSAYSKLNKLVKKSCKIDDNNWATKIATDLEEASKKGQQKEVWDKIKKISGKKKKKVGMSVRDKDGHFITDPDSQKERDEISYALKKLKNCKSAGVDEITNEQLKYGGSALVGQLELLFKKVWEEEVIPEDWLKGVIVVIGKKGDTSYCCNNRGITLRATSSKVLQMVLLKRLDGGMECLLRENQCGFRRNRSCIDQIYSIRTIIHNCIELNIPLYVNFIDFNFKAAFDSIRREFIWSRMRHYGLPEKYVRIFQAFFNGTMSAVRVHKAISHGAVPQKELKGADDKVIMDSDYADDLAVMDNTEEGLQESTDLIAYYTSYAGLKINAKKTQCMAISKCASQRPYTERDSIKLTVGGEPVEQLWKIWNSRTIRTPTKIRIYKAAVITILLYGAEVWNTTKKQMKRFEVFHLTSLRRILKIKWFFHVSNEEVLRRAGIKSIETFIGAARLRWYGHVVRMPETRFPNFLLDWKPNYGKRLRVRPRKGWMACVLEDAAEFTCVDNISRDAKTPLRGTAQDSDKDSPVVNTKKKSPNKKKMSRKVPIRLEELRLKSIKVEQLDCMDWCKTSSSA
ncbi:uncharacterized protein LOC134819840 [Bolinopsis microptera]|uniref:uncharacterized protein LOC134819840 n=1 Tax=Bolinopsis microptera TaxID=2820187 RepID=UPI00307AC4A1